MLEWVTYQYSKNCNIKVSVHKTKGLEALHDEWSYLYNNNVRAAFIFWETYKLIVYNEPTHSGQP